MFPLSTLGRIARPFLVSLSCNPCIASFSSSTSLISRLSESYAHSTQVNVCGRFSRHSSLLRPWFLRYIPKGGHPITVDYIDTKPNGGDDVKTILILHGTPGSYYDFFKFLSTFGEMYRIIIPNYPNFTYTKESGCFWHSAEEKSEFTIDFLKHLNVDKVDCLISHSMAAYTTSYLWIYANWDTNFKLGSICLLSPVGMYKLKRLEKMRLSMIANMCRSSWLRQLMGKQLLSSSKLIHKKTNSILANFEMAAWKALTLKLSNFSNYHLRLKVLADSQIPTLFTFSSNDKLVTPNVFYDQLFELGASADDFDIYEQYDNELIQSSSDENWLKVVDFRSSGHYLFNTHPDVIHSYIAELMDRSWVKPKEIEQESGACLPGT